MKLVIFGLTVSSSWGNGHATLWRGLCRALSRRGHEVVFFERDVSYYASHRDLTDLPGGKLELYGELADVLPLARKHLAGADVAMVTSYCPDAVALTELLLESRVGLRVFYDLDTPVTLAHLRTGGAVDYIGPRGLRDFDLVLSFTGGAALEQLSALLGAKRTAVLYGSVDPNLHGPARVLDHYRCDLSYLGTYAEDRQAALDRLLVSAAKRAPQHTFLIGGAQYPESFPWAPNIWFVRHVPPPDHPEFYSSCRFTLNVTRRAMADMGYCPSGRLFEAAACGAPLISDYWQGLDAFFTPGSEIVVARDTQDVVSALAMSEEQRLRIARAARERVLHEHTAEHRVEELERTLERARAAVAGEAGWLPGAGADRTAAEVRT